MGTWDIDAFGNDTACDWGYSLEDTNDLSLVESTIDRVLATGSDYLEVPDAEEALAAVEVIARLQGNWGIRNAYTEPVDAWVERNQLTPSTELVQKAHAAIDRIQISPSELLELWEESEMVDEWKQSVLDLRARVIL
jgi:hypothetical protein